jgi:ribulose-5-phosphate 4-epimerase/fuculose-1-phosphate aldolase
VHAARPDVIAAAHAHGPYGKTLSSLEMTVEPLTQDACAFFEDHAIFEAFSGVVYAEEEGERIVQAIGGCKALILQNHGLLTVGATLESAIWRYLGLENACQVQLLAEAAGQPKPIPVEVARFTREQVGSEISGIYGFKPYWDLVSSEEPDLFD